MKDYNNQLAQLRAGKSSKSKLLITKFKSEDSLNGWEVRPGTYFQDVVASKYDGGMDAKFEFTENGEAVFSGIISVDQMKNHIPLAFLFLYYMFLYTIPLNQIGYVFTRGGYVDLTTRLSLPLGCTLDRYITPT